MGHHAAQGGLDRPGLLPQLGRARTTAQDFIRASLVAYHLQRTGGLQMADRMVDLCRTDRLAETTDQPLPAGQTWPTKP